MRFLNENVELPQPYKVLKWVSMKDLLPYMEYVPHEWRMTKDIPFYGIEIDLSKHKSIGAYNNYWFSRYDDDGTEHTVINYRIDTLKDYDSGQTWKYYTGYLFSKTYDDGNEIRLRACQSGSSSTTSTSNLAYYLFNYVKVYVNMLDLV